MKLKYILLAAVCFLTVAGLSAQQNDKPTVYFIGDSTVRNGQDDGSNGQWGWGTAICNYFDLNQINAVNRAMGGTSSRTFYTSPQRWKAVLSEMKKGDYLLIQFGHNDGGAINDASRARATIPGIGEETQEIDNMLTKQKEVVHTFGWYLRQYVREAKAKGVTPIICSLIPRNDWDSNNKMKAEGPYAQYAKEVAAQEKVAFIDLNVRARQKLEAEGQSVVTGKYYLASDHTHTIALGAMLNALAVVEGIRAIPNCGLIPYLLDKPTDAFPKRKKLYIIGDSTVQDGNAPIAGWGGPIRAMFDTTRLKSFNRARGARSSQTYLSEGLWELIRKGLKPGDFVLVGFGHNDGGTPKGTGNEIKVVTKRDGTPDTLHTYGWNMRKFVRETKAAGAIPILFSQIPLGSLRDGKATRVTETFGKWLSEVAQSEGVGYVDLNELLATKYETIGNDAVKAMSQDGAHTNKDGAYFNAITMIEGLRAIRSPLATYILPTIGQAGTTGPGQGGAPIQSSTPGQSSAAPASLPVQR